MTVNCPLRVQFDPPKVLTSELEGVEVTAGV